MITFQRRDATIDEPHQAAADYTAHLRKDHFVNPFAALSPLFQRHLGQIN